MPSRRASSSTCCGFCRRFACAQAGVVLAQLLDLGPGLVRELPAAHVVGRGAEVGEQRPSPGRPAARAARRGPSGSRRAAASPTAARRGLPPTVGGRPRPGSGRAHRSEAFAARGASLQGHAAVRQAAVACPQTGLAACSLPPSGGTLASPGYSARRPAPPRSAELVVLRDAIRAGGRAGLDLAAAGRDREVGDRHVLGLARAVRHHGRVAGLAARSRIASSVSDSVPIWFTLTRIAFATPASMPRRRRSGFVTNRSSPTSWTRSPSALGQSFQPSQSSSSMPSSIETIG